MHPVIAPSTLLAIILAALVCLGCTARQIAKGKK
jgi:hypothetical protein